MRFLRASQCPAASRPQIRFSLVSPPAAEPPVSQHLPRQMAAPSRPSVAARPSQAWHGQERSRAAMAKVRASIWTQVSAELRRWQEGRSQALALGSRSVLLHSRNCAQRHSRSGRWADTCMRPPGMAPRPGSQWLLRADKPGSLSERGLTAPRSHSPRAPPPGRALNSEPFSTSSLEKLPLSSST